MFRRTTMFLALALGLAALPSCSSDAAAPPAARRYTTPVRASETGYSWQLVSSSTTQYTFTGSAVVSPSGAAFRVGSHSIVFPAGAVAQPTVFTATIVGGSKIAVQLSARKLSDGTPVRAFPVPLVLTLDYKAARIANPYDLVIAYVVNGQVTEIEPSVVDPVAGVVRATIRHFSLYALAN
jgi:hypothetical protein